MQSNIRPSRAFILLALLVLLLAQAPLLSLVAQSDPPPPGTGAIGSVLGQVYKDRAAFDAAVDGVSNISFEGLATGGGQINAAELDGDEFPGLRLTAGTGTSGLYVGIPDKRVPGTNDENFFAGDFAPTSGDAVFTTDLTGTPNGAVIVDFATATDGVGATFLDVEAAESYVEAFDGPGGTGNSLGKGTLTNQSNVSQSFVGVAAEGIWSAVLQIGQSNDGVGLDDLRYGSPGSVPDDQAPAAVDDLVARSGKQPGTIDLSWTATGDDGHSGTASSYIIRHNSVPITESNWTTSIDIDGEPVPSVAGSAESMTLSGMAEGQNIYLAIKTRDEVPNTSGISNSPQAAAAQTPRLSSALTDMSGRASLTLDGQEVSFVPFDSDQPGLPLPFIKITVKEYTTHAILLWEDTIEDRPPPLYSPAIDLIEKPISFSIFSRPLTPPPVPVYPVFLPFVRKGAGSALALAPQAPLAADSEEEPEGWDVTGPTIYPNTMTAYEGPEATIDGSEFADYMVGHHPDAKAFVFYHHDAVPSIDDAEMDIYETVDEGVYTINLRLKNADPSNPAEHVATHFVWDRVLDKISIEGCGLVPGALTYITMESFEHHNSQCIPVPNLIGKDRGEAKTLLQQMGFEVGEAETESASPVDQVIDQDPGPDRLAKCIMPGGKVVIEISTGLAPAQYEIYSLKVTTTRNRTRTEFWPGDTAWLFIDGVNHSSEPLSVAYSWQTTGPDGEPVAALSRSNWVQQADPHWRNWPKLEGPAPELCGEYTFIGSASFTLSGIPLTLKKQTYFRVGGPHCVQPDSNRAPNQPSNPSPADGATNQALSVDLGWSGGDPDFDKTVYDVFWGTSNPPATQIAHGQSQTSRGSGPLKASTRYYWQVVAWDEGGKSTEGTVWSFTTGAGSNPPPGDVVYIPAGVFQMGCDPTNPSDTCQSNDDLHSVSLSAYYVDRYEVTNAQYAQCVAANVCDRPQEDSSATRPSYYDSSLFADYPVIYVSWHQASDYCAWAGKRLPTEAEWEKAARGSSDTRAYPWGNDDPDCSRLNYTVGDTAGPCEGDTSFVGRYPSGQSPYGVRDTAGNVYEWTSDWYDGDYCGYSPYTDPQGPASGSLKVVRGGSWSSTGPYVRTARRITYSPSTQSRFVGFRCAKSP